MVAVAAAASAREAAPLAVAVAQAAVSAMATVAALVGPVLAAMAVRHLPLTVVMMTVTAPLELVRRRLW